MREKKIYSQGAAVVFGLLLVVLLAVAPVAAAINTSGTDDLGGPSVDLPVADFSADVTNGTAPLTVQFVDNSTGAEGWSWDFGDGANSTEQSPAHTYDTAGTYTVALTVTNGDCSDSEVKADSITADTDTQTGTSGTVTTYGGGSGTEADPYQISTGDDLIALSTDSENWEKAFVLTGDISLAAGSPTEPIGINASICFNGSFDGRGYTISAFTMNKSDSDFVGLFGCLGTGAEIKDLKVEGSADGVNGNNYVGVLAGVSMGSITNCSATGNVTAAGSYAGGLVGYDHEGSITDCSATGNASAVKNSAGGLVGENYNGPITNCYAAGDAAVGSKKAGGLLGKNSLGTITNCSATGNASAVKSSAGGLIGESRSCSITNCSAAGSVTAKSGKAGGLVGWDSGGVITNCYATGSVDARGYYAGGFVGLVQGKSPITNCYATGDAATESYAGGFAGETSGSDSTLTNCYAAGNATAINYAGGLVGENQGTITNCYRSTGGNESDPGTLISDITTFKDYTFLTGTETGNGLKWSTGIISTDTDSSKIWRAFADKSQYPIFQWQPVNDGGSVPDMPVLSFGPENASVRESQTTEMVLTVNSLPAGLAGYNLTISLDDPAVANITGIAVPDWASLNATGTLSDGSVWIKAADLGESISAGAANVTLATLTLTGLSSGTANITASVTRMDGDDGSAIGVNVTDGRVLVSSAATIPGCENPPHDLDGDGICEDVNGNALFDFDDVITFFDTFEWVTENEPVETLDVNGNGRIDFADLVGLYKKF